MTKMKEVVISLLKKETEVAQNIFSLIEENLSSGLITKKAAVASLLTAPPRMLANATFYALEIFNLFFHKDEWFIIARPGFSSLQRQSDGWIFNVTEINLDENPVQDDIFENVPSYIKDTVEKAINSKKTYLVTASLMTSTGLAKLSINFLVKDQAIDFVESLIHGTDLPEALVTGPGGSFIDPKVFISYYETFKKAASEGIDLTLWEDTLLEDEDE